MLTLQEKSRLAQSPLETQWIDYLTTRLIGIWRYKNRKIISGALVDSRSLRSQEKDLPCERSERES